MDLTTMEIIMLIATILCFGTLTVVAFCKKKKLWSLLPAFLLFLFLATTLYNGSLRYQEKELVKETLSVAKEQGYILYINGEVTPFEEYVPGAEPPTISIDKAEKIIYLNTN